MLCIYTYIHVYTHVHVLTTQQGPGDYLTGRKAPMTNVSGNLQYSYMGNTIQTYYLPVKSHSNIIILCMHILYTHVHVQCTCICALYVCSLSHNKSVDALRIQENHMCLLTLVAATQVKSTMSTRAGRGGSLCPTERSDSM